MEQFRKAADAHMRVGMVGTQRFLATLKSTTIQGLCGHVVALCTEKSRQVADARKRVRMDGTKQSLATLESATAQGLCGRVVALIA